MQKTQVKKTVQTTSGLTLQRRVAVKPTVPQLKTASPQAAFQRVLTSHTTRPVDLQRQVASPALQVAHLYTTVQAQSEQHTAALQRQIAGLEASLPTDAIQGALQRQAQAAAPAQARPTTPGDWALAMQREAERIEGKSLSSQQHQQFMTLQRHVTQTLVQGFRQDRQPAAERYAEYGAHLATLQRHPISGQVAQAAMRLLPAGERPALQRAVDAAVQRQREQEAQDAAALNLHALQRQLAEQQGQAQQSVMERIQARRGSGNPLPAAVQRHLEHGLNHDLSGVRIHDDSEADKMAKGVNAIAFTTGTDIFFQSGKFNPNTQSGLELLAHEVTHTVQQSQGKVGKGIDPDSGLESEAREMGRKLAVPIKTTPSITRTRLSAVSGKVSLQRLQENSPSRIWNDAHSFAGNLTGEAATLSISITNLQVVAKGVVNGRFTAPNGSGRIDGFMDSKGVVYWTAKYEIGALKGKERRFHGRVIQKPNGVPDQVIGKWLKQGQQGESITYALTTTRQLSSPNGELGDYTPVKDGQKLKLPNGMEITLNSKDFGPGLQLPTAGRYRPSVSQVRAGAEPPKAGENFLNPQPNNLDTVTPERDKRPSKQALAESRGIDATLLQANRAWTATEFMAYNGGYRLDAPTSVHTGWDLNTEQDNNGTAKVKAAGDGIVFEVDEVAGFGHTHKLHLA